MADMFDDAATGIVQKKKKPVEADSAVARCIDAYWQGYIKRWNKPSVAAQWIQATPDERKGMIVTKPVLFDGGYAGTQFKKMLKSLTEDQIVALIALFFRTHDTQVTRTDYTIKDFVRLVPRLHLAHARATGTTSDRTRSNLEEARRAIGQDKEHGGS